MMLTVTVNKPISNIKLRDSNRYSYRLVLVSADGAYTWWWNTS